MKDGICKVVVPKPALAGLFGRIVGFKTGVQTENKIGKIIAEAKTRTEGNICQGIKAAKFFFRIINIIPYIPDIPCICK